MKRVELCADDYGLSAAVNRGILRLAAMRRLSSSLAISSIACALSLAQFAVLRPLANLIQPWQVHALGLAMALVSTVLPIWSKRWRALPA